MGMICCVLQDQGMQQWGFMMPVAEMQAIHVTSGQTSGERIATKRSAGHPDIKLLANCHNRSSGPPCGRRTGIPSSASQRWTVRTPRPKYCAISFLLLRYLLMDDE